MIPELRKKFNSQFSHSVYEKYIAELNSILIYPVDFRVSETPLFLSHELSLELQAACDDILRQLRTDEFKEYSKFAAPEQMRLPNEDEHPQLLQIDFAICKDDSGNYFPQLIELQGFPSLYGFQYFLEKITKKYFNIPEEFTSYFSGYDDGTYLKLLKETIVGDHSPENVVLLEIHPEQQKTRVDFAATEKLLGIKTVCLTKLKKRGKKLFYSNSGKEIPISRIYNRVIQDELFRKNILFNFNFRDELDVEWVPHPNWFFKISKHSLPFLKGKYVPDCISLAAFNGDTNLLKNYVLKPLYSFAGSGVEVDVTPEKIESISDRENYILQKKIEYAPLIETPDEKSRVEIRMMYLWNDQPLLVNNLVRMGKGKMMGVDFNKARTWVGSNIAFHQI